MTTTTIRVLLADDQTLIREGLAVLLGAQPDIEVVGEAADGTDAVAQTARLQPDVVLMDVRMPGLDGIAAARQLLTGATPTRVLMLTTFDEDEYVYAALRAGASGFVLKTASAVALAEAVRAVAGGEAALAPSVTARLLADFTSRPHASLADVARLERLTDREAEVLTLVAQGMSNAEIAAELIVAEQTVKTHVSRVLAKLELRDRTQAAMFAHEHGLARRLCP
ncbi:response regulator [Geodermatophilus marinus]|uniref:response regulator n=1 Tax=Geodermatophilus sp. LHW52908 TaxID=2303986 RepID=UPI000E3EDB16|nr:response regulator transcription factor [Geodermatophilus sp. LHW52908]RFU19005.1 DNA-binding response regulator [Geodermatophilus sp. LHW52908]